MITVMSPIIFRAHRIEVCFLNAALKCVVRGSVETQTRVAPPAGGRGTCPHGAQLGLYARDFGIHAPLLNWVKVVGYGPFAERQFVKGHFVTEPRIQFVVGLFVASASSRSGNKTLY